MKVLITEFMDDGAVARLRSEFEVVHDPELYRDPDRLAGMMGDIDGLIVRNRTQVRGAVIDRAARLKVVGRLGVGLDNLDCQALDRKGIPYFPATGANSLSVAEYVVTAAMVLLRGAYFANAAMLAGRFPKTELLGRESAGKTLGLVGYGAIARLTAQKAKALNFQILAYDPHLPEDSWEGAERAGLAELAARSDVVSLHVPLTDETRHLIDSEFLSAMKPDAILINAARGGVVDEDALVAALKAGTLGGAAIDCFEEEPLSADAAAKFADLPNLILTPHIAGNTTESNIRVSGMVADAVAGILRKIL